jgi:TDG/mug DNA glycosylase family protein
METNTTTAAPADAHAGPLPDYLAPGLRLVVVGINPGLRSAATGHHYAGPGNLFWPLLHECGLLPERLTYAEDHRVLDFGIGLTNLVARASRSVTDLTPAEMRDGADSLREKLRRYQPGVVCFNGKAIYAAYSGRRQVAFGEQPAGADGFVGFVMPSTSARTAAYQRAAKLAYFRALRDLVDREAPAWP